MPGVEDALEFIQWLFGSPVTERDVYLSSLANERDGSTEIRLQTRNPKHVERFIAKNDVAGRGLFICAGTVNGKRNKDNIAESVGAYCDIDFKDHPDTDKLTIDRTIARAKLKPTIIVHTGHGLHLWWLFHKGIDAQSCRNRLETVLRALAEHFGGDTQVAEISRLMRLPGTHNTKYESWVPVVAHYAQGNARYTLEELEEWLVTTNTKPLLQRCVAASINPRGSDAPTNPFIAIAQKQGYQPPVDVEALLAGMVYPGNVHATQLSVSAALLERGFTIDEVVARLISETGKVPGTEKFNWKREMRDLFKMCTSWVEKHPQKSAPEKPELKEQHDNVTDLGAERLKRKPAPATAQGDIAYVVADGVIGLMREQGYDIMLAEGEVWIYFQGFWSIMTPAYEQRLRSSIQFGFEQLNRQPKGNQLTLAWTRLMQHPNLVKVDVPWADAGIVVCQNGVLLLDSGVFGEHAPENYARRHIGAAFVPGETCPVFEKLLASMFTDRDDADEVIELIQEWAGASLAISSLSREERRALVLVGPSRTGKTELARIFALLLGDPIATPAVSELGERFGLSTLYGATAWIRDDAINEGDKLDPQRFKTIVTGEPINIELKGRHAIQNVRLNTPVLLTCNSLPRARDGSDAIFNRSIVISMTNVIDEAAAKTARLDILGKAGDVSLGAGVFELESAGILNWAILGLARLRRRGFYHIPESVGLALQQFKDENNPVGEWKREALEVAPGIKVERRDLVRSYNGWETDMEGDEARTVGGRWLLPKLRALIPGLGDIQGDGGRRYITGVKLTSVGLAAWESYAKASAKPGGFATSAGEVNQINIEDEE